MTRTSTLQLVALIDSDNRAEELVSLFRSAGRIARVHRPGGDHSLEDLLAAPVDLILIDGASHAEAPAMLEQCRALAPTVSVIVVDDGAMHPWFLAGAADVVTAGEPERLVAASLREVERAELHRHLQQQERALQDAQRRHALLLAETDQAVAYMADGVIIHANARFAERFGHDHPEALDCTSIAELVDPGEHERLRAVMRVAARSEEGARLPFLGQHRSGQQFEACMLLNPARYDGEDCIQIAIIQREEATGPSDQDLRTGLASPHRLETELALLLSQRGQGRGGCLIYHGIDDFYSLRSRHGLAVADELARGIAQRLQADLPAEALLAARGDDGLVCLLPEATMAEAMELARQQLAAVASPLLPTRVGALQCSLSAGVLPLNAAHTGDELVEQGFRLVQQLHDAGESGQVSAYRLCLRTQSSLSEDELNQALGDALEDGRLTLTFQPIISLRASDGEYYEVGLEPTHSEDAEEITTLLSLLAQAPDPTRLDRWVIMEAARQLAEQRSRGGDTRLLINLGPQMPRDSSLPAWLGVVLKAAKLPASALTLQMAAAAAAEAVPATRSLAEALRALGCGFSLAGLGDPQRDQALLERIPMDWMQLDPELCRSLQQADRREQARQWVDSAAERGIGVVITEVDSAATMAVVWQLGASHIQGPYLQAPDRSMSYAFTDIA